VPLVMSASLISLVVIGAGGCTLLCCGSETVVVPTEGGCCVVSRGGSAVLAEGPGDRMGISGAGVGVSGPGVGVYGAEGMVPEGGAEGVPLSAEWRCSYQVRCCRPLVELLVASALLVVSIAASDWCDPSRAARRLGL
jgi:hypothetical protein